MLATDKAQSDRKPLPMTPAIHPVVPDSRVEALLSANDLPVSDLKNNAHVVLFGCTSEGTLDGVVGLELYGEVALLRSLAVPAASRSNGLGAALVAHAERHAADQGVGTLYLLTTTAAGFFERHGYRHASREQVPAAIAGTPQFSSLCPSSSAFMAKPLRGQR